MGQLEVSSKVALGVSPKVAELAPVGPAQVLGLCVPPHVISPPEVTSAGLAPKPAIWALHHEFRQFVVVVASVSRDGACEVFVFIRYYTYFLLTLQCVTGVLIELSLHSWDQAASISRFSWPKFATLTWKCFDSNTMASSGEFFFLRVDIFVLSNV